MKNPTYTTTDDRGNITQVEVEPSGRGAVRTSEIHSSLIQGYLYLDQARRKVAGFHPADKVKTIKEYGGTVKDFPFQISSRLGYEPNVVCNIVETR